MDAPSPKPLFDAFKKEVAELQRITLLVFVVMLVCAGCGSAGEQAPGSPETAIVGQVFRSPTQPVCVVNVPCKETFVATFHVYQNDLKIMDFQTGADGKFRLEVGPGNYVIVPDATTPILSPESQAKAITVPEGAVITIELDFDTGIR